MSKKTMKGAALVATAGMMLGWLGCLDGGFMKQAMYGVGIYVAGEYLLDNDTLFDLVESGDVPVVE